MEATWVEQSQIPIKEGLFQQHEHISLQIEIYSSRMITHLYQREAIPAAQSPISRKEELFQQKYHPSLWNGHYSIGTITHFYKRGAIPVEQSPTSIKAGLFQQLHYPSLQKQELFQQNDHLSLQNKTVLIIQPPVNCNRVEIEISFINFIYKTFF